MVGVVMAEISKGPHVGTLSSRFPCSLQPSRGLSIRERMFRVARRLPLYVVSPTPWVPLEDWFRQNLHPTFRPSMPEYEEQQGIPTWFPRFLTVPGPDVMQLLDGWTMFKGAYSRFAALHNAGRLDLIDAHGAYPEGYAAVLLGRQFQVPVTITLHGDERVHGSWRISKLCEAFKGAARIFTVNSSLRQFALELGVPDDRVEMVSDGIDVERFYPHDRNASRAALGISPTAPVLLSSAGVSGAKGYKRLIESLPTLSEHWPDLVCLLAVGLDSLERHARAELEALVEQLNLKGIVRFLDTISPNELASTLSAADVFVFTAYSEGSATALLEAMACGVPVVAFDIGSTRELVSHPELGELTFLGDPSALRTAIDLALSRKWDRVAIRRYGETFHWDGRVNRLCRVFAELVSGRRTG